MGKFDTHYMDANDSRLSGAIRERATDLDIYLQDLPAGREKALAMTKLEECIMWANKAIVMAKDKED